MKNSRLRAAKIEKIMLLGHLTSTPYSSFYSPNSGRSTEHTTGKTTPEMTKSSSNSGAEEDMSDEIEALFKGRHL